MKHIITESGKVSLKLTTNQIKALSYDIAHTNDFDLSEATCKNFHYLIIQNLSIKKFNKANYNYKKQHSVMLEKYEVAALANRLPIDNSPLSEMVGDYLQEVLKELEVLYITPVPKN